MALSTEDEIYFRSLLADPDPGLIPMTSITGSADLTFDPIKDGEIGIKTFALTGALVTSPAMPIMMRLPSTLEKTLIATMVIIGPDLMEVRLENCHPTGLTVTPAVQRFGATLLIG